MSSFLIKSILTMALLCIMHYNIAKCESLEFWTTELLKKMDSNINDPAMFWNMVTLQAAANDFDPDVTKVPQQAAPTLTSRAFAIIYGCIYEGYNYYYNQSRLLFPYKQSISVSKINRTPAVYVTITEAAYQALLKFYGAQISMFKTLRDKYIDKIKSLGGSQDEINVAIAMGQLIVSSGINGRVQDGNQKQVSYSPKNRIGFYAKDQKHPNQKIVTPHWGGLKPFILKSAEQFRPQKAFGLSAAARLDYLRTKNYHDNYEQIEKFGDVNSTVRTEDQTIIAKFWGYDGAQRVGVPPRLYMQVVETIARQKKNKFAQNAQMFAWTSYAMADVGIAAWDAKFHYDFPRPITAIRSGSSGIKADPTWTPLGAQPGDGKDSFTPAFLAYVSGHASFRAAVFQVLRRFYGTDRISFELTSDEYNGKTRDSQTGRERPKLIRKYQSLTEAQEENKLSRVYLGVHWMFDQTDGDTLGVKVGNYVCDQLLR